MSSKTSIKKFNYDLSLPPLAPLPVMTMKERQDAYRESHSALRKIRREFPFPQRPNSRPLFAIPVNRPLHDVFYPLPLYSEKKDEDEYFIMY